MNVLIIEEALEGLHGHWFQYLRDMVTGGRMAGHSIQVLCHQDACEEIISTFGAKAVLSKSVWTKVTPAENSAGRIDRLVKIRTHNQTLFQEVFDWVSAGSTKFDFIIFPTVRIDHLWAIHKLTRELPDKLGKAVAIFCESPGLRDENGNLTFGKGNLPLRLMMRFLRSNPKLLFATESEGLIDQYRDFSGCRLIYLPHTTTPTEKSSEFSIRELGYKIIGLSGFTRFDKGLDILHSALRSRPLDASEGLQFLIQWTGNYFLPDGTQVAKDPILEKSGCLTYVEPFSTSEEYSEFLSQVDAIVLPYRRAFYADKLSRVAIDAALAGLPMIYPRKTWVEEFVTNYAAGVGFDPESPKSLNEAISKLSNHFEKFSSEAADKIGRVQHHFSGQNFFAILEKHLKI